MPEQTFEKADEVTMRVETLGEHPGVELVTISSLEAEIIATNKQLAYFQSKKDLLESYRPKFAELGIKHPDEVEAEKKADEEAKAKEIEDANRASDTETK